jgi:hypothetical protein
MLLVDLEQEEVGGGKTSRKWTKKTNDTICELSSSYSKQYVLVTNCHQCTGRGLPADKGSKKRSRL